MRQEAALQVVPDPLLQAEQQVLGQPAVREQEARQAQEYPRVQVLPWTAAHDGEGTGRALSGKKAFIQVF